MSDRADSESATHGAVHGRQARLGEGRISTSPRFLTLKLLPFSAPPGGIYLINKTIIEFGNCVPPKFSFFSGLHNYTITQSCLKLASTAWRRQWIKSLFRMADGTNDDQQGTDHDPDAAISEG